MISRSAGDRSAERWSVAAFRSRVLRLARRVTFVDTSALLAFLDRDAADHAAVVASLTTIPAERRGITHN